MTTLEAITELLNDYPKCLKIGMTPVNYRRLKFRLKNFKENESLQAYHKWLILAGYKHKTSWERKKNKPNVETPGLT